MEKRKLNLADDAEQILGIELCKGIRDEVFIIHWQLEDNAGVSKELTNTLDLFKQFVETVSINFEHKRLADEDEKNAYYYIYKQWLIFSVNYEKSTNVAGKFPKELFEEIIPHIV